MAISRLPRLAINWFSQPETFRRYWDQVLTGIEDLRSSFETTSLAIDEIRAAPIVVDDLALITDYNRAIVSDATTAVFGDVVVGGGANTVPVYFDGADWRIG